MEPSGLDEGPSLCAGVRDGFGEGGLAPRVLACRSQADEGGREGLPVGRRATAQARAAGGLPEVMRVRIPATPRPMVSRACAGGPQPKLHGQRGMEMEPSLDAGTSTRSASGKPPPIVPPAESRSAARRGQPWEVVCRPRSGTNWSTPRRHGRGSPHRTAEGATAARCAPSLAAAKSMPQGIVPAERRAGKSCAEGAPPPDAFREKGWSYN